MYYLQINPRAKCSFDDDPDFNPYITTLSWSESAVGSPSFAILVPSGFEERLATAHDQVSRQNATKTQQVFHIPVHAKSMENCIEDWDLANQLLTNTHTRLHITIPEDDPVAYSSPVHIRLPLLDSQKEDYHF